MRLNILLPSLAALLPLAFAEDLQWCGAAQFYPSKYTCFGTLLCPKTASGEAYIACGTACYDAGTYYCDSNTQLQLITVRRPSCSLATIRRPNHRFIVCIQRCTNTSQPDSAVQFCGSAPYKPGAYTCWNSNFLCPVLNGEATLACGGTACYNPREYACTNGQLGKPAEGSGGSTLPPPQPTCGGLYGE